MVNFVRELLNDSAPIDTRERTGFWENVNVTVGLDVMENLPIVSRMITPETEKRRQAQLTRHYEQDRIPEVVWADYQDDWDGLANYANQKLGLTDVATGQEFQDQVDKEYDMYRTITHDVTERADVSGMAGQLFGSISASALDPLYWPGFFIGGVQASTFLKTFALSTARIGGVEVAIQIAAQPMIMDHKAQIGAEYSAKDALVNGLFAVGGATGIGVTAEMAGKGLRSMTAKQATNIIEGNKLAGQPAVDPIARALKKSAPEDLVTDIVGNVESRHAEVTTARVDGRDIGDVPEPTEVAGQSAQTTQRIEDVMDLETRQKQSRLEELSGKKKLTEVEVDELEMLTAELKEAPSQFSPEEQAILDDPKLDAEYKDIIRNAADDELPPECRAIGG